MGLAGGVRQVDLPSRFSRETVTLDDYRRMLDDKSIDAVIIATPDHWHARMAIDAMNAGKDVYLEKPMVQRVDEGQEVIDVQRQTGKVLQVGSQRVSSIVYAKAKELLAAGVIGPLNFIEARYDRNSAQGAWQYSIPTDASPQTVDWDQFLGHAPKRPFEPIRLFRWRNYQDYGTGVPGDLFVHLFSGIHHVLDSEGPTRVMATGGLRHWLDGRDVPPTSGLEYVERIEAVHGTARKYRVTPEGLPELLTSAQRRLAELAQLRVC